MSDPHYTDPRLDPPLFREDSNRAQRLGELETSNAMWGWIAGGVVLALLLLFVFGRAPNTADTASNNMNAPRPGPSTLAPPSNPAPTPPAVTQAPSPTPPATTGQGTQQ